jgi:transitional endoplasmic reticulum ATPase
MTSKRELSNWKKRDVGIVHEGDHITLPANPGNMPLDAAIDALERKRAAELQEYDVNELIEGYPFDALVALYRAMVERFGWAEASTHTVMGFFGPREYKPDLVTVRIGPKKGDVIQVPTGRFELPGVKSPVFVGTYPGGVGICTTVNKAGRDTIMELVESARHKLATDSIYRGKAMRLPVGDNGHLDTGREPVFMDTDHVAVGELILPGDTAAQVAVSVFTPIKRTEACKTAGIPLKRGVLLEGPYGTGKTMTAAVVSRLCVENGWTFISLDNASGLRAALEFAQKFQPAVVFCEDIDRVTAERNEAANDLLNTIDGVLSKNSQVMTILTTNHVERINKAMLRPGRLDAVISITPPDAEAAERLVRLYGRNLIPAEESLVEVGAELAGQIPATIRETVERAKLAMISRDAESLSASDLLISAKTMTRHRELLAEGGKPAPTLEAAAGEALGALIANKANGYADKLDRISEELVDLRENI